VTETDSENRNAGLDQIPDRADGVIERGRIARPFDEKRLRTASLPSRRVVAGTI
jgi:hypothetical protein